MQLSIRLRYRAFGSCSLRFGYDTVFAVGYLLTFRHSSACSPEISDDVSSIPCCARRTYLTLRPDHHHQYILFLSIAQAEILTIKTPQDPRIYTN